MGTDLVRLFLSGDVMLGRGIDQILPHPGDPSLPERYVSDARAYVSLAETAHGPVPRPAGFGYPWGAARAALDRAAPDARIVNLETAVTHDGAPVPGKAIHYRMHPANLPCLATVRPDVCVLANNHVLDYGHRGLDETLDSLAAAGLRTAGAGRDSDRARRPAVVPLRDGGRIIVVALGLASSGVPSDWAATAHRGGIDFAARADDRTAARVTTLLRRLKSPGDIAVVSLHWGSNWGYTLPATHIAFAHTLIDGGADIVHGHSSHHPRPLETYRGKLILHGCGDLIDDYEGISGHEEYRDDLRLLHVASVAREDGRVREVRLIPLQARRLRLEHASGPDTRLLHDLLGRISRPHGTGITVAPDGNLIARPA